MQAAAGVGKEVREEHVRVLAELHEHRVGCGILECQPDAPLAAVGVLHDGSEGAFVGLGSHPSLSVTRYRVLDLDDVGAPVGQHGPSGRSEGELGYLHHLDALHRLIHGLTSLSISSCGP